MLAIRVQLSAALYKNTGWVLHSKIRRGLAHLMHRVSYENEIDGACLETWKVPIC